MNTCPKCVGEGKLIPLIFCSRRKFSSEELGPLCRCDFCGGSGKVDDAALERHAQGRAMSAERLARSVSLRKEAARLGISPSELSRREQGYE